MDYVENLRPLKPKSAKGNRPQNQYVSLPSLKKQQGVDIGFMGISVSQAPTQYVEREKNVPRPIIEKPTLTYYQQKTVENSDTSVPSLPTLQEKFPSTKSNPYTTKSHKDISKSVSFGQPTEKELIYQQAKPKVKELTQRTRRPLNEEFRRHDSEDEEKLSRSSKKKSKSGIIQPSTVEVFEKLQGRMAKNNSLEMNAKRSNDLLQSILNVDQDYSEPQADADLPEELDKFMPVEAEVIERDRSSFLSTTANPLLMYGLPAPNRNIDAAEEPIESVRQTPQLSKAVSYARLTSGIVIPKKVMVHSHKVDFANSESLVNRQSSDFDLLKKKSFDDFFEDFERVLERQHHLERIALSSLCKSFDDDFTPPKSIGKYSKENIYKMISNVLIHINNQKKRIINETFVHSLIQVLEEEGTEILYIKAIKELIQNLPRYEYIIFKGIVGHLKRLAVACDIDTNGMKRLLRGMAYIAGDELFRPSLISILHIPTKKKLLKDLDTSDVEQFYSEEIYDTQAMHESGKKPLEKRTASEFFLFRNNSDHTLDAPDAEKKGIKASPSKENFKHQASQKSIHSQQEPMYDNNDDMEYQKIFHRSTESEFQLLQIDYEPPSDVKIGELLFSHQICLDACSRGLELILIYYEYAFYKTRSK